MPALREQEIESRVAQEAPPAPLPPGIQSENQRVTPRETRNAPPLAVESVAPLPAAGPDEGTAHPRADSRAKTDIASRVPSNRAYEVRRNEAGEDVPVGRSQGFAADPRPLAPAPPPAAPGEPVYVRKPRYAEPLVSDKRADALQVGARPRPADAGASAPSAEQDAPVAAAKAAREEESKSVVTPRGEQTATARKDLAAPGRALGLMGLGDRTDRGPMLQVRGTPEAFDGLPAQPRALAKNAQRLTVIAEKVGLAPAWDSAAAEWERVIEGVQGGPLESETRFQVARARFMAWQRAASEKRGAQATQALRTFLEHAPQGAERDSAQAWLTRLKK